MAWSLFGRAPSRIGPYEILDRLGKGGAGSVFKARHLEAGNVVAIKVLCAADARDPVLLKRFEQEFHVTRTLDDPHIVRGLDFGRDGTLNYLVMEFVDGPTLHDHLQVRGRLAENEALSVGIQIAQALHHAHERGMIHRDVKPGNILLSADGRTRLLDFGVAKCVDSRLKLTQTRMSLGTPCFMAPEQFSDCKRIDRRCDVYGLAATLYVAITGNTPFLTKGCLSTLRRKQAGDLAPPRRLVPSLSLRVDWAIMRALSASPAMRPASCAEFVRDMTGSDLQPAKVPRPVVQPARADEVPLFEQGKERRAAMRYACRLAGAFSPIGVTGQKPWPGQVRDISASGLGLILGRRFEPGTVLNVTWEQTIADVLGTVMARVVRAGSAAPGQWLLGCQLATCLSEEDVRALLKPCAPAGPSRLTPS